MPPAISVSGLVVRYGETVAVDGLDLEAEFGQVVALLGPNGAGKTTTVETLEGYRKRASGQVEVLGLDPGKDRRRLAARIGVMLQGGGVYPALGALEALRLFAAYYDNPRDPAELLATVGLEGVARRPWRRLSGGERQRLALALALVGRPEVAFLDEPTAGVDPHGRLAIRDVITSLRDSGVCVLLTTHELEEAERLADRLVIVDRGRVVASGTVAELTAGADGSVRFAAPPAIDVAGLAAYLGRPVREEQAGEYVVEVGGPAAEMPALVARLTGWLAERELPLAELRVSRQRLEDVFLRLTGDRH
jgi:ABC-2 type transport system ATP-binding protein